MIKKDKQEILRQGKNSDFWRVIVEALKESKEYLQKITDSDDLKELPADQYKVENELLKAKRKYLDKLSELPDNLILWLENPDNKKPNFDPYSTIEDE